MDQATIRLGEYAVRRGVSRSAIVRETGLPKNAVYSSLSGRRPLKADEFLQICGFLQVNPFDFLPDKNPANEKETA